MIRVLIADDHEVVRAGLAMLLARFEDLAVVGEAADGAAAIDLAAALSPDVVLMDLSMPGVDGVQATRAILEHRPEARVVVLTTFADQAHVTAAIEAGAVGFLLKDTDPAHLGEAIRAANRGEAPLDPRAATALLARRREPASPSTAGLTTRERDVLQLVGEGLSNRMIARRLGIAEKTVKTHLTRVFNAIGVTDRVQAALWWERHGDRGDGPPPPGAP
jgi:DNA-binding NarL/FixJ family response regulator